MSGPINAAAGIRWLVGAATRAESHMGEFRGKIDLARGGAADLRFGSCYGCYPRPLG